jgi:membrane associated rhomboid family serine protease
MMPSSTIVVDNFQLQARILGSFVALIWGLELVDQLLLGRRLDRLGIRPHTIAGLRGILFAPLLHGSWGHLATNTTPFVVLGWLVMLRGMREFIIVTLATWIVSGLGVWLFGTRNTVHVGASGLIFGYFGFLLFRSYFEQDLISAGISIVVAVLYGPMIWGVLPLRRGISWQGHMFGLTGGVLTARYLPQLRQWFESL